MVSLGVGARAGDTVYSWATSLCGFGLERAVSVCAFNFPGVLGKRMNEIWVFVCHDCGSFGAALVGGSGNEYFDKRIRVHDGHRWEICGDDDCRIAHWHNWTHDRIAGMLRLEKFPAIAYFGNF